MSRLRDEAIKAAEDKKEEEKKREEEEREKKPGKDGIRVRLKIVYYFSSLSLELLQVADAAEPADRAEDQRLCEAADVRERSRVGDVEEEEALPNFCIRFVFLLSFFTFLLLFLLLLSLSFFEEEKAIQNFCIGIVFLLYIYVEGSNLQQDCFLMESFVAGY